MQFPLKCLKTFYKSCLRAVWVHSSRIYDAFHTQPSKRRTTRIKGLGDVQKLRLHVGGEGGWCYFHSLECHSPGSWGVKITWKGLGDIIFNPQGGWGLGSENNVTQALPCYFHSPIFLKGKWNYALWNKNSLIVPNYGPKTKKEGY